jgi:hypothetical protein
MTPYCRSQIDVEVGRDLLMPRHFQNVPVGHEEQLHANPCFVFDDTFLLPVLVPCCPCVSRFAIHSFLLMTMYKEADNNNLDNNNGGFQPILEDEELHQHGGVPMEIDVPALSAISNHEANTEERRPRIQFNEDGNHVVTIEPFYEFSDEEHSALWYTVSL